MPDLRLPDCPLPRPGDQVSWFQSRCRYEGELIGHGADGRPVVATNGGIVSRVESYDSLRLADDAVRVGANWLSLPASANIVKPGPEEGSKLRALLEQRTPPGPKYIELVSEIWARGFEVFVVGGTVRDIVGGTASNDVDLITTMPLDRLVVLTRSMYGQPRQLSDASRRNGHLRLGGDISTSDPFIDVSVFKYAAIGTDDAVFGSDFMRDVGCRDFACNSIYFDPNNDVLIDPSGIGLQGAERRELVLVAKSDFREPFQRAQIVVRFFKFACRGFTATPECEAEVLSWIPCLAAMSEMTRIKYIRGQLLGKVPPAEHDKQIMQIKSLFSSLGIAEAWELYVEPIRARILA